MLNRQINLLSADRGKHHMFREAVSNNRKIGLEVGEFRSFSIFRTSKATSVFKIDSNHYRLNSGEVLKKGSTSVWFEKTPQGGCVRNLGMTAVFVPVGQQKVRIGPFEEAKIHEFPNKILFNDDIARRQIKQVRLGGYNVTLSECSLTR